MLGLLQRVISGRVDVSHPGVNTTETGCVGEIGAGLLVLVGVEAGDDEARARKLAERLLAYRVFPDDSRRMNLSVTDVGGGLLLVPQFTLAADTSSGLRPSLSTAAPPDVARTLFDVALAHARTLHDQVESGRFGAHMQVSLVNDGPVTFLLKT